MLIFIDTNIFFNHWFLRAPIFDLLANYVVNAGATLLVSEVVCEEMNAKFRVERRKAFKDLSNALRRAGDFRSERIDPAAGNFEEDRYDFRALLRSRFENVQFLPFDSVPHAALVDRAIAATRPFRDGEKGYRDSLMWLSLVDHLKEKALAGTDLVFVNANAHDFFEKGASGLGLHPDLDQDWKRANIQGRFVPFLSLKDFADAMIDKVLHSVRHDEFREVHGAEMEGIAARTAIEYLQALPLPDLQQFLEAGGISPQCARAVRSASVEDFEGVEDPEIVSISKLNDESLYIEFRFNLLTVMFYATVDTEDYLANEGEFDDEFINIEVADRVTTVETFRRCDFDVSLTFQPSTEEFTAVSVDRASPRQQRSRHRLAAYSR